MNISLEEFRAQYLEEIRNDSRIEGVMPGAQFFADVLTRLQSIGDIVDPLEIDTCNDKVCRKGRKMSIDAYSFDESDKSVCLYINDYVDSLESMLTHTEIMSLCNKMLYFLEEAYEDQLKEYFDASNEILQIGKEMELRLKRDYLDVENDISLDKVKLYIITNKRLSAQVKSFGSEDFRGKKVEINVWSLERIYDLIKSGKDKEAILVDIKQFGSEGIPCIKAEMSGAIDYDAYLAIIPGLLLHKIYYEFGSRLLEGNIRAFLTTKGKINRGIRDTIHKEPTKFFTYNNGIACTASRVELDASGSKIIKIEDLQIINGGQTTASLTSAKLRDKIGLENIFVPLKMTVVKNDDYDTMIGNISKYANSQNKVTDADMFSNHPFHRRMEDLANKILAPIKTGEIFETHWYYERSRGKYEQQKFKFTTQKQKDDYAKKWPKQQVIKKEELAKYFVAAEALRPDLVAKGSQFNMKAFATTIDKSFESEPEKYNDSFFKKVICYAILYRETDKLVNKAEWYHTGGYKLNIVPYTISKLISLIPSGCCLDYDLIWKKQALPPSVIGMLKKVAYVTNQFIQQSGGTIVTEYCKKQATWDKYKQLVERASYMNDVYNLELNQDFVKDLINASSWENQEQSDTKESKRTSQANIMIEVFNLGAAYWSNLITQAKERKLLSPKELEVMRYASIPNNPLTEPQAKIVWKARQTLANAGVLI
ncbi:MAG: AIPR family protein [Firmicutes bacterium]|nr:AIPR family protein [Bacillota bacterium]